MSNMRYPLTLRVDGLRIVRRLLWAELCDYECEPSGKFELNWRETLLDAYDTVATATVKAEVSNFRHNNYQPDEEFTSTYWNKVLKEGEIE